MLNYKGAREEPARDNDYLGWSCQNNARGLITSVACQGQVLSPAPQSGLPPVLSIPFLRLVLLFKSLDMAHRNTGHDLQKDVLWGFSLKDSFISSRGKAGIAAIISLFSHPCAKCAQPCSASGIS